MVCKLPEDDMALTIGFYNGAICVQEIKSAEQRRCLKADIRKAFTHHALDILCLSGRGQLHGSLDLAFAGGIPHWMRILIADRA